MYVIHSFLKIAVGKLMNNMMRSINFYSLEQSEKDKVSQFTIFYIFLLTSNSAIFYLIHNRKNKPI